MNETTRFGQPVPSAADMERLALDPETSWLFSPAEIDRAADGRAARQRASEFLLTAEEVEALTGYVRPSAQRRALVANAIPFRIRPDGRPVVLRADLAPKSAPRNRRATGPDLAALDRME